MKLERATLYVYRTEEDIRKDDIKKPIEDIRLHSLQSTPHKASYTAHKVVFVDDDGRENVLKSKHGKLGIQK